MKDANEARLLRFIWLTMACGADAVQGFKIYSKYTSIDKAYAADGYDVEGISDEQLGRLLDKRLEGAFEVLKRCRALGVRVISIEDDGYPKKLKTVPDPPLVLYCKGRLIDFDKHFCIAMVGTRSMSDYGFKTAKYLAEAAAAAGAVVISGLAKGVDSACQRSALNAGGFTVGVIGNSIDTIYPKESASLFNKLYESGLVMGEYWPGCRTNRFSFPKRNRIIAALSDIVVVVEAPAKSGALITASHAARLKKPVYVPPMPLTEENAGTAALLRGGARLITSAEDMLAEYADKLPHKIPPNRPFPADAGKKADTAQVQAPTPSEKKELAYNFLLDELEKNGPETLESAVLKTRDFTMRELISAATALELDGFIIRSAGGRYDVLPADTDTKD